MKIGIRTTDPYRFMFKWHCKIIIGNYTTIKIKAKTKEVAIGMRDRIYAKLAPEISQL